MNMPIGVLQGRLTPSHGRGIQFFPQGEGEWEREFAVAASLGVSHIQWAFDSLHNPLLDNTFRTRVKEVIQKTGIAVKNLDLQLLVAMDVVDCTDAFFESLCIAVADIQAGTIELPLMEHSSLLDEHLRMSRLAALERFLMIASKYQVGIALETDLPPQAYADVLSTYPALSVVYDSGNSAGMGYDTEAEIAAYGKRISNVHIKDKHKGGPTVPLGSGSVDFPHLFQLLAKVPYAGAITLQVARGEDGEEVDTVTKQVEFVAALYEKYF